MVYRIIITARAEELIDKLVNHLLFEVKSEQAAVHLLNGIEHVYDRLEDNPLQFQFVEQKKLSVLRSR